MRDEIPEEFKVGDIVEAYGIRGVVTEVTSSTLLPIIVTYTDQPNEGIINSFTANGRSAIWHKAPSLKLIERPKKKVKKTIKGWVNVYPGASTPSFYWHSRHADSNALSGRIACVELTGEYEVEE